MKSIDQFRSEIIAAWKRIDPPRTVKVMEVCGTHTVAVSRSGLRDLLPEGLRLISGPGCPVCVTDQSYMDAAVWLARRPEVIVATYGDMLRVPGRDGSLEQARTEGASVEVVYSAAQSLAIAREHPGRHVVFLGIGFETTTPGAALAILQAQREGVENLSVFSTHKRLLPVMWALLAQDDLRIDAFLCPGHVSVILGWKVYEPIARGRGLPCVVAGFEDENILAGVLEIVRQIADGAPAAGTVYGPVTPDGNARAREVIDRVFVPRDDRWRGLGLVPDSGLGIRPEFARFDTEKRFGLPAFAGYELPGCRCGDVIAGRKLPPECPLFGVRCTPRDPVGPCMVSSEGSCAAYFRYHWRGKRPASDGD